jgi:3',5'-nucleoside bisphosphate phosphatase
MKIDLHLHTTASDSTWTPEVLVKNIIAAQIGIFAVTDHDSVDNVLNAQKLAAGQNLTFIHGVEISAAFGKKTFHILAYGIDINSPEINNILLHNRNAAELKTRKNLQYLADKGFGISLEEYDSYDYSHERGGWKSLNYLIDKGLCTNHKDYFSLFIETENPFNDIDFTSLEKVIPAVKLAGGIPVIAHPGANVYTDDHRHILNIMFNAGIEGVECYHPENNPEVTEFALDFCKKNNLYITGGSDCHGDFVKARKLGNPDISDGQLYLGNLIKI